MKKFKSCIAIFLVFVLSVSSFLSAAAMVSDDEVDSDTPLTSTETPGGESTLRTQSSEHKNVLDLRSTPDSQSDSSLSQSHTEKPAVSKPETESQRKNRILENYPPDLSNLQEIGFGVKIKTPDGREVEQRVHPDVHFLGVDGKEYLVFYNTGISQLRKAVFERLQQDIKDSPYVLSYDRSALIEKASSSKSEASQRLPIQVGRTILNLVGPQSWIFLPVNSVRKIISLTDKEVVSSARIRATICANLNNVEDIWGTELIPQKLRAVVVDRELNQFISLRETPRLAYEEVEERFSSIVKSDMSDRDVTIELGKCMDELERKICPRASSENTIDFCFALNRASYYLSMLERDLQNKDLKTLEVMDSFRRKVNNLMLKYRFIYERNGSPILGIRIDRCKIIVRTELTTMIFLDREETRKFTKSLNTVLDNRATNITKKYSMDSITATELRDLAESLDPNSCQDLIDQIDKQIGDLNKEAETLEEEARVFVMKAGMKLIENSAKLAIDVVSCGTLKTSGSEVAPSSRVDSKISFTPQQVEAFVKAEECPKDEKDTTSLGQTLKELGLSSESMSNAVKGLKSFSRSKEIRDQIETLKKKRSELVANQNYLTDFINMVKLYIRLNRGNFDAREDFEGVLIEEIRKFADESNNALLREYIVREINRLEDIQ